MTDRLLLQEALVPRDDSESSWEAFADDLAALHRSTAHEVFGWPHEGGLGRVTQHNYLSTCGARPCLGAADGVLLDGMGGLTASRPRWPQLALGRAR